MSEQLQWFASQPEYADQGPVLASDTEAYGGHLRKARELTKQAVDAAIRADGKESGAIGRRVLRSGKPLTAILLKRGSRRQKL